MAATSHDLKSALQEARRLIASPGSWLAGGFAADAHGCWLPVGSRDAARFSLAGALLRVTRGSKELHAAARAAVDDARDGREDGPELTHRETLELLDAAIAMVAMPSRSERVPSQSASLARRAAEQRGRGDSGDAQGG